MRLLGRPQQCFYALHFLCVALAGETCAHELEAQVDEVGIEYIRFAILAYANEVSRLVGIPHLRAREAHLARQSEQAGRVGQGGAGATLIARQHVHQIDMPPVNPAEIVVVAKCSVLVPCLPISWRLHTGQQRPVVKYRQVEPRAVPRAEARRKLLDPVKEPLDQLTFRSLDITEAPDAQSFATAQDAGNGNDTMLFMREELTARRSLPAQGEHGLCDLPVGNAIQAVKTTAKRDVGDRLDIEYQGVHDTA